MRVSSHTSLTSRIGIISQIGYRIRRSPPRIVGACWVLVVDAADAPRSRPDHAQIRACNAHTAGSTFRAASSTKEGCMSEKLSDRRDRTRREGKCQMCETAVPLAKQYTVENDLTTAAVKVRKNAARKGSEAKSHYCGACKDRRVKQRQAWLNARAKRLAKAAS